LSESTVSCQRTVASSKAILLLFAEQLYGKARNSELPVVVQGLCAQAIISYYNVKTQGTSANLTDWLYCLIFPAGVALSVAAILAIGLLIVGIVLIAIVVFIVLALIGSS